MITSLSKTIVLISFLHLTFLANRSNIHLGVPKILNGSSEYFTVIVIIFLATFILTIFYQGDKQGTGLSTEYHITDAVRLLGTEGSGINQDVGFFFYWHVMLSQFLPYIKDTISTFITKTTKPDILQIHNFLDPLRKL